MWRHVGHAEVLSKSVAQQPVIYIAMARCFQISPRKYMTCLHLEKLMALVPVIRPLFVNGLFHDKRTKGCMQYVEMRLGRYHW